MAVYPKKIIPLIIFLFIVVNAGYSQNPQSYLYENEFDFSIPLKEKWSMDFGLSNRGMLQERNSGEIISGYQHEHVEVENFVNYQARETLILSLGMRYRFKELFNSSERDEFRIIEQLELELLNLPLSQRLRLEHRFMANLVHRLRYDIEYTARMNQNFSMGLGTEALYAISGQLKPEVGQRFSIGLETSYFHNLELGLGLEYRMENYARNLSHEFFIVSGLTLNLGNETESE